MKKRYYLFILLLWINGSCSDFLEHEPYGPKTAANFWKTESDLVSARNALTFWTAREGIDGRGFMWFENCSDNLATGRPSYGDYIKHFQMTPDLDIDVKQNWSIMYQLIAKCNDILRFVPTMTVSESSKNIALAEAHFYTGFAYMWLAPWYGDNGENGGIPIVTPDITAENLDVPRPASILNNYDYIIASFRTAGEILPTFGELQPNDYGRPHKAAAWAFAARAALYAAQYDPKYFQTVIEMCDNVMSLTGASKRELYPDYGQLFEIAQNYSREYIYSIPSTETDGSKFPGMGFQNGGWGEYNTWGYFQPTLELYKAYETRDKRRGATIIIPGDTITFIGKLITYGAEAFAISSTSGMTFRKWMSPFRTVDCKGKTVNNNTNNPTTDLSVPLIRYADVLLMKAEALIWKEGEGNTDAKSLLNQIRKRAGLPENSDATKIALKNERRCELAFEFQPSRHLDLVRWGDAKTVYAQSLHGYRNTNPIPLVEIEIYPPRVFDPTKHHVFPIPAADISKSRNLKQNKGY